MLLKKIELIFILGLFGLGLVACGDGGTGSADKAQPMIHGTLEAYDPDVPSMAVEDNGVVFYGEEIYKN